MATKFNSAKIAAVFVVVTLISSSARSEFSYVRLKGMHELFTPECSELSMINGFTYLNTKILQRIRFLGAYGPKKQPFGCHEQILDERQQTDCPQDWVSTLLQLLFPSPDGMNFVANQRLHDPLSSISFASLGRLLTLIKTNHGVADDVDDEWKMLVFKAFHPEIVKLAEATLKKLPMDLTKANKSLEARTSELRRLESKTDSADKIADLTKEIERLKKEIGRVEKHPRTLEDTLKAKIQWTELEHFATALFYSVKSENDAASIYPQHISETILLSYAWKKAADKSDVLALTQEIARAIPTCIAAKHLDWLLEPEKLSRNSTQSPAEHETRLEKKQAWLNAKFDANQYADWKKGFGADHEPTAAQKEELQTDPELAAYYATSFYLGDAKLPPLTGYSTAAHESLGKVKGERKYGLYPDCGETSLRNFFNIVLFDRNQRLFSVAILEKIIEENKLEPYFMKDGQNDKGLVPYYRGRLKYNPTTKSDELITINSDPAHVGDVAVHDDWSRRVVSGVKGVDYLKGGGVCEIDAGISNMQTLIAGLLGDPKWPDLKNAREKFDRICQLLSRDEFDLDWSMPDGSKKLNGNIGDIIFRINGVDSFKWHFGAGHFSLEEISSSRGSENWLTSIGAQHPETRALLPWFVVRHDPREAYKNTPIPSLFWYFNLENSEQLLTLIDIALSNDIQPLFTVVKAWIRKLPGADIHAQLSLLKLIGASSLESQRFFHDEVTHARDIIKKALDSKETGSVGLLIGIYDFALNAEDTLKTFFAAELAHAREVAQRKRSDAIAETVNRCSVLPFLELEPTRAELEFKKNRFVSSNTVERIFGNAMHNNVDGACWKMMLYVAEQFPDLSIGTNPYSGTAAYQAVKSKRWDIAKKLLEFAPEALVKETAYGETVATEAAKLSNIEFLNYLFEQNPQSILGSAEKIASDASVANRPAIVEFVLDKDPTLIKRIGGKLAYLSVEKNDVPLLRSLHQRDPEVLNSRWLDKPLSITAVERRQNKDVLLYLLGDNPERILDKDRHDKQVAELVAERGGVDIFLFVDVKSPNLTKQVFKKKNSHGDTVLSILLRSLQSSDSDEIIVDFLSRLRERGVLSDALKDGLNPLGELMAFDLSRQNRFTNLTAVEFFVDNFATVLRMQTSRGENVAANAAIVAASAEKWELVMKIIDKVKSEPQMLAGKRSNYGNTLRQTLEEKNKQDIIKILDEIGVP